MALVGDTPQSAQCAKAVNRLANLVQRAPGVLLEPAVLEPGTSGYWWCESCQTLRPLAQAGAGCVWECVVVGASAWRGWVHPPHVRRE